MKARNWLAAVACLALVMTLGSGCTTMGAALVNDQTGKAGALIKAEGEALALNTDPNVSAAGGRIASMAADIVLNSKVEAQTTYEDFDLSQAPPYSPEASKAARDQAVAEHESGGVWGTFINAVGAKVPWIGWGVTLIGAAMAVLRGRKLRAGLEATVAGVTKWIKGEQTAKDTLINTLKDEHVQASVMPTVQAAIARVKDRESAGG